jgi:drug/metabolite transporter (DMT)-like permease
MLGIAHTSASASQVIYAAIPILILIISRYFQKHIHSVRKITGIIIGFFGIALIVYLSAIEKGETIAGSLYGNSLVIVAMLGWTTYLLSSKQLSRYFAPLEIGSTTITVGFLVS